MPEQYIAAIMKFIADRNYKPLKSRQIARQLGVMEEDYGAFRQAIKQLRDEGRIVLGDRNALTLPAIPSRVVGHFRANAKGFGFVVPETPNAHGDLYIAAEDVGGAMNGDRVVASVSPRGRRGGEAMYGGRIIEILERGQSRFVGELQHAQETWFVLPDGSKMTTPILVQDISSASPPAGTKVVVEIVRYPKPGELPLGVIVETLGQPGHLETEIQGVIRAYGLADTFPEAALREARRAVDTFDAEKTAGREDLSDTVIVTIDPPDARDFDDAISLTTERNGYVTLGVHIADVSHFVVEGGALDAEARRRSTSVYFPRKVVPMLPEILSNGVCSLQEGVKRFCKSAFITYDADAKVVSTRFAETIIQSFNRLTYLEAQGICDGKTDGFRPEVVQLLGDMERLARRIEARRRDAGMLHLDLPEVELVLDDQNKVIDAVPSDDAYTHTMIEMFMVEANEAVAGLFDRLGLACLRRIHPAPDTAASQTLKTFIRACGHRIPMDLDRRSMQQLLDSVRGKPESYAVNLALLKTFQQAEYSPARIGHYALASEHYCHFTSPIRRYPDLTVHRLLAEYCRGRLDSRPPEDLAELNTLGENCTAADRRAEAASSELRDVLLLQMLADREGEQFRGVITGVTSFGLFVQSQKYLIEGLVRLEDLGDDWWEVSARNGQIVGERSGRSYRIGDLMEVGIASVNVARRQLNLVPVGESVMAARPQPRKKSLAAGKKKSAQGAGQGQSKGHGKGPGKKTTAPQGHRKGTPSPGAAKKKKSSSRPGKNARRKKKR